MTPTNFPQMTTRFGKPEDWHDEQCKPIGAFVGEIQGGTLDGLQQVVVAWQPSPDEIAEILGGKPVFLTMVGGLAPHFLTTNFEAATHPA